MHLRSALVAVALVAVMLLTACGQKFDTYEDPSLEEILKIGKAYLKARDGGNASEAFTAAVNVAPDSPEAKYGLLIARNMQFLSLLDQLIGFIGAGMYSVPDDGVDATGRVVMAEVEPIGDYIQEFLGESADVWYQTCEQLYTDLQDDPDPRFEISGFTMGLNGIIEFEFGGELDSSDLQFFGVLNSLVRVIVDIAMAHDINYDFFSLEIPPIEISIDFENFSIDDLPTLIEQIDPIVQLVASLLSFEENPDFLTLKGEEGVARMQAAGIELGQLFWRMHLLIDTAYRETGEQPEHSVRVIDSNQNGRGDRHTESLYLPGLGELDAELVYGLDVLGTLAAGAFWDTTEFDVHPGIEDPLYISFANELLTALDVLPIVIDHSVLGPLLESLGLPADLLGDDFQIVISEIPEILPIDVGPWFADPSPTGIKDLLWNIVYLWDFLAEILPLLIG